MNFKFQILEIVRTSLRARSAKQSIFCLLFALLFLSACTDYAAKMEDDLKEWKTAKGYVEPSTVTSGKLFDARDGRSYKTVTIGEQTWMAQNLDYETENSYCHNDADNLYTNYGCLYLWNEAVSVCPNGWHLPNNDEWEILINAVGGSSVAGKMLKSASKFDGLDSYFFAALSAGMYNGYNYDDAGFSYFWSSSKNDSNLPVYLFLTDDNEGVYFVPGSRNLWSSVRCVKNLIDADPASSSSEKVSSSSKKEDPSSDEFDCSVTGGVKVVYPASDEIFKIGDTITVIYGSDVQGSGYRFLFKAEESDSGLDMLEESVGPKEPDGKTCYEQKVVLGKDFAEPSKTAVIRVVPYEQTAKGANSGLFVVKDNETTGTFTDLRDGRTYKIVTIGTQTWMAENLNYETTNSFCYDSKTSNCTKYGRLYTWSAAMDSVGKWSSKGSNCGYGVTCSPVYPVQGVCPNGWHLPSKAEFETLFNAVGDDEIAGKILKSTSGWYDGGNGSDAYSFAALPAGIRSNYGSFSYETLNAFFWSSTEDSDYKVYYMYLYCNRDDSGMSSDVKNNSYSVRCLKD